MKANHKGMIFCRPFKALQVWLVVFILVFPSVSCADNHLSNLFWPPPPAEPRVFFVKHISGYQDLGIRRSFFGRIKELFVGKREYSFKRPMAVAVGNDGCLYLTDMGVGSVYIYYPQKKRLRRIFKIDKKIDFVSPVGIGVTGNGTILVTDSFHKKVFAIDDKGRSQFVLGQDKGILRPTGIFSRKERIYVVDTQGCQIFIFDLAGKLIKTFGKKGKGDGDFNFPTHIFVDEDENIYVSDTLNSRVQIFDGSGLFLKSVGSIGNSSGHFSRPKGIAVDSFGHIYVVDALFDNIQIFDYEKRFLLSLGEEGSGDGQFWLPAGMAITKNNEIYVADSYNKRISVYQYVGKE